MRLEGAHMLRGGGRQPKLRTIGALGRSRRFVVLGLCLLSVYAALGLFAGAAEAATPSGALGALNGASDTATPFSALQRASRTANSSPDPSLVGSWSVTSSCSGSPCGDTLDISIGGQQASDPACSANEYCITTQSGFYAKDVSATPNGGGSWTYTCNGCTGSENISVTFKGDTFTGMATGIAPDGSVTGTVPYSGSCSDCVAHQTYEISGTLTNNNCGCSSVPTPEPQPDVTVSVASDDGAGVSASGTSNDNGVWSVDVPDGDYTVTPDDSTYSWDPTSQPVTVDGADEDDINFDTCGNSDETADLRSGGPIARTADAAAKDCTSTTLRCLGSIDPSPAVCVVAVQDITTKSTTHSPTPPTGNVAIMISQLGSSKTGFKQPDCTLIPDPGSMSTSACTVNFEPVLDRLVNPNDPYFNYGPVPIPQPVQITTVQSFQIKAFYNPPDATHSRSGGAAQFKILPAKNTNYWSTEAGKNILKYWALAEGGGYIATNATLNSAKAAKVVTPASKFISGAASEYLFALGTGLQLAAWSDGAYAAFVDPFDPDYKVVAKPKPLRAPIVTVANAHDRRMLNSFLNNVERQHAVTTVLGTTEDRAASAHKLGDKHAYELQERAISQYLRELANLTDAQLASQMAIERALKKLLKAAHIGLISSLPRVPHARYAAEVASDPQTRAQAQLLLSVGAPNRYVADVEAAEEDARIPAKIDLLTEIVNPVMIRDERKLAAMLRAEARKVRP